MEGMPTRDDGSSTPADEPLGPEPTQAEIEEWAARERKRREAWLSGPTEAEKALWAEREYERRSGQAGGRRQRLTRGDPSRRMQRYARELQLATEGALSLLFNLSISEAFDRLVQAGREWEEEFTSAPPRRRRVPLEPESTEPGLRPASAALSGSPPQRVPPPPEGPTSAG
jgi:hypothetical protein